MRRWMLLFILAVIAIGAFLFLNTKTKQTTHKAAPDGAPNIVVILIDALRPDHMSAYGYDKPTSPVMDQLAADGILFEEAVAQSHSTFLSVPSLFSSLFPLESTRSKMGFFALKEDTITIAERFKEAGYFNAAFSTNSIVHEDYGLAKGFDTFFYDEELPAEPLTDEVLKWLDKYSQRPFFMYIHYLDPHSPYTPPDEFRAKFVPEGYQPDRPIISRGKGRDLKRLLNVGYEFTPKDKDFIRALYDGEIASADWHIGRLIERLREMELYDDTIIVLIADHGEEFWERGQLEHAKTLYEEIIRVPLILKLPASAGRRGERVPTRVELLDVFPTLLELAGLPPQEGVRGKSLLEVDPNQPRWGYAEALGMRTLRQDGWKLIDKPGSAEDELYNLNEDKGETNNLIAENPQIAVRLKSQIVNLTQIDEPPPKETYKPLDPETERRLRALGYID